MINYFNFKKFSDDYLLTNDFGKYIFLKKPEFKELLFTNECSDEIVQNKLKEKFFIYNCSDQAFCEDVRYDLLAAKKYLFASTQLHIFVVTNICNMQCVYCQAQNGYTETDGYMDKETAKKAVDFALSSPSDNLQFEFQGGEPLINFDTIKYIVNYSQENKGDKVISYSVVTNLTLLTDEILSFIIDHNISVCTSLDGDQLTHDLNRPFKNGSKTYKKVIQNIEHIKSKGIYVGALLTVTRTSLSRYKEIIDSYVNMKFDTISIRSLSPLGCADKSWNDIGYSADEFIHFYQKCLDYIIEINKQGTYISEGMAKLFLTKIIDGIGINYMELRSPCGASFGQMAYYYNGNIYTCDEGRMLAEMGNNQFCLGDVFSSTYDNVIESKKCRSVCIGSITESLPSCSECVYQPYCGVCPIVNYSLYGDIYEKHPNNYKCLINKGILDAIFEKLYLYDTEIMSIFRSWLN